jgi:uncharacterized protein (TIGR02246 family)
MKALLVVSALLATSSLALAQDPARPAPARPPQSPTFPTPAPQNSSPDIEQLTRDYEAAFNKGDAKALAGLYTADALRLGLNNEMLRGRAAIEQFYVATVGGAATRKLTIRPGRTQLLTADVALTEGTYQAGDGLSGVYVITMVRQNGQWRLAAVVPVPQG